MAQKEISQLKEYFRSEAYPTAQQFADTLDSFRHKDEGVPIGEVEGLGGALDDKLSVGKGSTWQIYSGKAFLCIWSKLRITIEAEDVQTITTKTTVVGTTTRGKDTMGVIEKWSAPKFGHRKISLCFGNISKNGYIADTIIDGENCYIDFYFGGQEATVFFTVEVLRSTKVAFSHKVIVDASAEAQANWKKNNADEA